MENHTTKLFVRLFIWASSLSCLTLCVHKKVWMFYTLVCSDIVTTVQNSIVFGVVILQVSAHTYSCFENSWHKILVQQKKTIQCSFPLETLSPKSLISEVKTLDLSTKGGLARSFRTELHLKLKNKTRQLCLLDFVSCNIDTDFQMSAHVWEERTTSSVLEANEPSRNITLLFNLKTVPHNDKMRLITKELLVKSCYWNKR